MLVVRDGTRTTLLQMLFEGKKINKEKYRSQCSGTRTTAYQS
jgi:hypothetical protein